MFFAVVVSFVKNLQLVCSCFFYELLMSLAVKFCRARIYILIMFLIMLMHHVLMTAHIITLFPLLLSLDLSNTHTAP